MKKPSRLADILGTVGKYDYKTKKAKTKTKPTARKRSLTGTVKEVGDTNETVPTVKPTTKAQKKVAARSGSKTKIEASDLKPRSKAQPNGSVTAKRRKTSFEKAQAELSKKPAVKGLKAGETMADHPGLKPVKKGPAPTEEKPKNNSPRGGGARNRGGTAASTSTRKPKRGSGVKGRTKPSTPRARLTPAERRAARRGY